MINMYSASFRWVGVVVLICMFMSGCASVRTASTLQPSGETQLKIGQARFSIISYTDVYDQTVPRAESWKRLSLQQVNERAKFLYPDLFTDEWTALPIMIESRMKYNDESIKLAAMLTGLTLGIIPFTGEAIMSYSIATDLRDVFGESLAAQNVSFDIEMATWVTLVGPLGSIPIPGQADLPRDTVFLFIPLSGDPYATNDKVANYSADCIIEAVVKNLRSVDIAALESAYMARQTHLREVIIDGQKFWSFLVPHISQESGRPVSFAAMFFQEKPKRGTTPYEQVVVARRDGSTWTPVTGYLRRTQKLTAVSTLMENGLPARVVVRVVEEPPLEDFIDTPDLSGADRSNNLRWSNGILLEAKNRSLEKMLQIESRDMLLNLATRIEKSILDLNEQSERAKDRAQTMVGKGEGDPAPDRELSILCRQRIEVLKPILAAIKQEAATRKRE